MVAGLYIRRVHCDSWILAEIVQGSRDEVWENLLRFSRQNPSRPVKALSTLSAARKRNAALAAERGY